MYMTRIGEKIKFLRNEKGLTQKTLGKKLGVSESFINELETGRKVANESIIKRISKVFGKDLDDINMYEEDQKEVDIPKRDISSLKSVKRQEVNDVWDTALGSILKSVPVYKTDLKTIVSSRKLPIISNKIEGYAQDKVFFIEIQNNDMIGFRIAEGDIAFAHIVHEAENNSLCLLEHDNKKIIRQIKKLDSNKLLLVSNNGSGIKTQTVYIKEIKPLAKLDRLEIVL
ncbi:MAG: putative transcriptional regulator [Clostridium sp.]|nr:putative transcriptional regulator [Clostridium sp.]